jgi:type I restriction enzyme, S subunit
MALVARKDLLELSSERSNTVASSAVRANSFRLDASAFLSANTRVRVSAASSSGHLLADIANVFTVYIQTPILHYVAPFAHSRPYLTTSELGEYQRGRPTHVSLLADPRLIEWQIARGTIVLSRSGRVGEAYWVDKKLADALVGDSFRVVPRNQKDAHFVYALLASSYARDYVSGARYGSVVDHASVDQVRSLPVPALSDRHRARVSDLVQQAVLARDAAYDLLDASEAALLRANGLGELRNPKSAAFDPLGQPEWITVDVKTVRAAIGDGSEYRLDAHFYNPTAQLAVANIRKGRSEVKIVGDVTERVFFCNRFTRTFVDRDHGIPYLAGKDIVQIRPTDLSYLSRSQTNDLDLYRLQKGWLLMTCSGTIGRTCLVWKNFEEFVGTHDLIRIVPDASKIDGGYLYAFLSSAYGKQQVLRYRHGSVIDHVTPEQVQRVLIPLPSRKDQTGIGDKVREAHEKRAEAIRLEDEAQAILMKELTKVPGIKEA